MVQKPCNVNEFWLSEFWLSCAIQLYRHILRPEDGKLNLNTCIRQYVRYYREKHNKYHWLLLFLLTHGKK